MKTSLVFSLLLFGIGGHGPVAMAQSPGTFTATGNMTTGRVNHTATLLLDGKVLIAGGARDDSSILSSAEIYDPATGTFTPTGGLTRARGDHSATLLPDGRVLITGGLGPISGVCSLPNCGELTSAEIYDPANGTFTETGDMISLGGPAVLLPSGKVFISGGRVPFVTAVQAELYDPSRGTFSATTAETPWRSLATLLANGQVLLTGHPDSGPELLDGDVYDPATDTVSPTGSIDYETATLLMNGKVLFGDPQDDFPGTQYSNKTAQLYDHWTGTFTVAGSMTELARAGSLQPPLLPDGTVLIAGTEVPPGGALASAEIYDPVVGTFGSTGSMMAARYSHKATLLNNGQVLITGGFHFFPATTSSAELYTPPVLVPAPVLFSLTGDGRGQGAIWHSATGQVASATNPAVAGEALSMYTTGLADGSVIPPQVIIGGRVAEVPCISARPGIQATIR